jgi:predicted RNA-binding Zn-ribbon protein involved in translation (DUF1610 family)
MTAENPRGRVYRCPVCGAEILVLATQMKDFRPRCCNTDMIAKPAKVTFYYCPVCGAQIAVLRRGAGAFAPRCCNTDMRVSAA